MVATPMAAEAFISTKSLCTGLSNDCDTFVLGMIPGPLLLGGLLDATCVVWGESCKRNTTSCWIYNNASMACNMALFVFILILLVTCMLLVAFQFYLHSERRKKDMIQSQDKTYNTSLHEPVTGKSFTKIPT